jgi:hypothetical protein
MKLSTALLSALVLGSSFASQCTSQSEKTAPSTTPSNGSQEEEDGDAVRSLPEEPKAGASSQFWDHWGDGKAELAGYEGEVSRYDELRDASMVLIYVTEPHDRRTWIKDDSVAEEQRVNVLKLNRALKFQTGIYPYSVMTSVFSPVSDWGMRRFQPTKVTLTSQEWCGQVFTGMWPLEERFRFEIRSYFASEGDEQRFVQTEGGTLYQDALPIQLRELDGPFNDGEDWQGKLVPSLWHSRKAHTEVEPVDATIERTDADLGGTEVTRFVLRYDDVEITYDIEKSYPHRLLRWKHSNGGHLRLVKSSRLAYWKLNGLGDESYRKELGLEPIIRGQPQPAGGESDETRNGDATAP